MKRILILLSVFLLTACTSFDQTALVYNPVKGIESGAWQMALLVEMNTNFSSLLYDKTRAKFENFSVHPYQMLPKGAEYFVLPVIYTDSYGNKSYDKTYPYMIANYLRLNNYGKVTDELASANYVIMVDVMESPEKSFGTNTSNIALTIMEKDETPVLYVNAFVTSKSDKNFYYWPSKTARPVKYLTLKGFEKIFEEAIPYIFS